ncbi:ImmA/IrrE family metallo-endopeptidase [Confluentibacter sediminis]|uniref:ImmA/IrrE family metallo-endopeptidase n=1 Tax=Confluentibacter sediminis TaxID=2219045 RepID=UPI000DACB989|nr:ImmA/IrrE family metallo-endopeptidase [Confluentibacter sediminis]
MINRRIESITEGILKELNITSAKKIDVKKICKSCGVDVKPENLDVDVSGLFVIKQKGAYIRYNNNEAPLRQKFTIAHEFGHFVLHKDTPLFISKNDKIMYRNLESSTGEIQREREANSFAASLLMPRKFIIEEINKTPKKIKNPVSHLAKTFGVSEQAMTFRLANLGFDIGLINY